MNDTAGRKTENELIVLAQNGQQEAMDAIVSAYLPLIRSAARRFSISGSVCSKEELVQSGVLGLMKAIRRYAHREDSGLGAYSMPWILGEMRMTLRRSSESAKQFYFKNKIEREQEKFYCAKGRMPTISELAQACALSETDVKERIALGIFTADNMNGASPCEYDAVPADAQMNRTEIRLALDQLSEDERRLILLRYFRDMTQTESAQAFGKSQTYISRLERRALDHLKELLA